MTEKQIILKNHLVSYYAVETEPAAAKTAIFLHGWRANGMIWTPVVKLLSEQDYNIYCLDLPGFGKSEFPQKPFYLKDYAEIVKEFIEKLELAPSLNPSHQGREINKNNSSPLVGEGRWGEICVVGHSFGGRVAAKLSAENPGLIKKLVLADCGGFRKAEWKRGLTTFFAKIMGPAFAMPLLRALRPRIYNILGADDYLAIPELKNTFINVVNEDLLGLALKIRTPTLIIWGENDRETPLEFGKKLHTQIPHSIFHILKSAGHFSFLDKPEEFVRELINFLES